MFRNVTIQGQDQDRSIGSLIPIYCYINTCCSLCNESKKVLCSQTCNGD